MSSLTHSICPDTLSSNSSRMRYADAHCMHHDDNDDDDSSLMSGIYIDLYWPGDISSSHDMHAVCTPLTHYMIHLYVIQSLFRMSSTISLNK